MPTIIWVEFVLLDFGLAVCVPEFTLAISWSLTDRRTVRVLSQHFAAAFARAFPHHAPTNFTLAADSELSSVHTCIR